MAKTIPFDTPYKVNEKVRATVDLPDVPRGTGGKVQVANGFRWRRYWVRFDNGVALGQVDQAELVRARDWERWEGSAAEREEAALAASDDGAAEAGGGGDGAGGGVAVNGVTVPQKLLDRSASARARLAG